MTKKIPVDPATVNQVLTATGGEYEKAAKIFTDKGTPTTAQFLRETVDNNPVLKAFWSSAAPSVIADMSIDQIDAINRHGGQPMSEAERQHKAMKAIEAQDKLLAAQGLKGVGFSAEQIQQFHSMISVVQHGFRDTVDFAHGSMISSIFHAHERVQWIMNNVLLCEDKAERWEVSDGQLIRFEADKYTPEEKLEWQKEWRGLLKLLKDIAGEATNAAALRLKAQEMELKMAEMDKKQGKRRVLAAQAKEQS